MSKSFLKQCHDQEIMYEPVYYSTASDVVCASNCNSVKKPWLSNNNDPLQDFIRRSLAGKVMRRSNERVPIVYSTLSKEKGNRIARQPVQKYTHGSIKTNPRQYYVTSTPVSSSSPEYHPYLEQKRDKYVVKNGNGLKGPVKNRSDSQQFISEKVYENKFCNATDRLDFIQRYITQNTDQYGYVALNEMILKELGTAIMECLSRKITVSKVKCEPLYEPISPAGCSEDED